MSFHFFKKEVRIYAVFFAFAVLFLILFSSSRSGIKKGDFVVVLDYGNGVEKKFTGSFHGSISAWDTLQQVSANSIIKLEAAPDFYPQKIDSWENGKWGKNWTLYINGKKVSQSPIDANINMGDTVLWKFE